MLKQLSRVVSEPLKGADVKDLASALTVLANEKLKAEKAAEKGGTKAKGGRSFPSTLCGFVGRRMRAWGS